MAEQKGKWDPDFNVIEAIQNVEQKLEEVTGIPPGTHSFKAFRLHTEKEHDSDPGGQIRGCRACGLLFALMKLMDFGEIRSSAEPWLAMVEAANNAYNDVNQALTRVKKAWENLRPEAEKTHAHSEMYEGRLQHNHEANCVTAPVVIDILNAALPLLDILKNLNTKWIETQLAQGPGRKRTNLLLMETEDHLLNGGYSYAEVSDLLHGDDTKDGRERVRSRSREYKKLLGIDPKTAK